MQALQNFKNHKRFIPVLLIGCFLIWGLALIAICFLIIVTSYITYRGLSSERDLSTPSSRLIGHWQKDNTDQHFYFGPIDKTTNNGIRVRSIRNWIDYFQYTISSEDENGTRIKFKTIAGRWQTFMASLGGGYVTWTDECEIAKNGMKMQCGPELTYTYIDDKVKPRMPKIFSDLINITLDIYSIILTIII